MLVSAMLGTTSHGIQHRLRHREQMIPVMALPAQSYEEAHSRDRELGAVAFFRKPVDDQALLDSIHWILGAPKRTSS